MNRFTAAWKVLRTKVNPDVSTIRITMQVPKKQLREAPATTRMRVREELRAEVDDVVKNRWDEVLNASG